MPLTDEQRAQIGKPPGRRVRARIDVPVEPEDIRRAVEILRGLANDLAALTQHPAADKTITFTAASTVHRAQRKLNPPKYPRAKSQGAYRALDILDSRDEIGGVERRRWRLAFTPTSLQFIRTIPSVRSVTSRNSHYRIFSIPRLGTRNTLNPLPNSAGSGRERR